MNAVDLMIQQSGVCEKLNCTIEQVKELFYLWKQGFTYRDTIKDKIIDDAFLSQLLRYPQSDGLYQWLLKAFNRDIRQTDEFLLEIEIKKAAGTFEEYIEEIEDFNELNKNVIEELISAVSKITPPINVPNRQN